MFNSNEPTCYAYNDGSITVQSTGGSGGLVYSWDPTNPVTGNTFNNLTAGIYTAYVTDVNGCMDSIEIDLGQPDSLQGHFTIKDILCFGDSTGAIIVDSVSNAIGTVSYFWNLSGVVPNPPPTSNIANGLPIGTYVLNIQDALCNNQYEFTLVQNPAITFAEFGSEPAFCRMFSYQSGNGVVFASATGGVPDYEYEWINLGTGASTNNTTWGGLNPGNYQMTVTDDVGCELVQTIQLDSVSPIAAFDVISAQLDPTTLSGTAIVCAEFDNNSQYFANENDPNADTTFFWELGYNLPWQLSQDVDEVFDTCYYSEAQYEVCLVALNKNGCTDTACKIITIYDFPILVAPNVFTPGDGDAVNMTFEFDTKQTAIVEFECTVYDRWGKEMFVFTSITDKWDGTTKGGRPATDGVYFYTYKATASNGTPFEGQGTVTLIRGN
ncbi:MAG: gliding motility-associated C-terminal domain-containing protein [Crocinitomicaceae bacterium]|nr:gliding motility-associated C-terminal domain-containing protein [Crocinitomicaceae bacterium]